MTIQLKFGLNSVIPEDATTAWGARLIVTQDGYVDFVHDRQGCVGEDCPGLLQQLSVEFGVPELRSAISGRLRDGVMSTRDDRTWALYRGAKLEVWAGTNASGGYCYVAAWAPPKEV